MSRIRNVPAVCAFEDDTETVGYPRAATFPQAFEDDTVHRGHHETREDRWLDEVAYHRGQEAAYMLKIQEARRAAGK